MLFDPLVTPSLKLANRIVMAPLTRSRAVDANTPNALMAEYYGQRATAGLIITEGTSPSPNGLGYARIPGLFTAAHVEGWKLTTSAVHAQGGKIFIQLMHCGRVAHVANLPQGAVNGYLRERFESGAGRKHGRTKEHMWYRVNSEDPGPACGVRGMVNWRPRAGRLTSPCRRRLIMRS